jgi:hypothetical protein
MTCPFDWMNTNYSGIVQCIRDDFKDLCDLEHLKLITLTKNASPLNELAYREGNQVIVNTKYRFIFNNESPVYGDLHIVENWEKGACHFTMDNFKEFIIRYENRVKNFREYMKSGLKITFVVAKIDGDVSELFNVLREKYPELKFKIHCIQEPPDRHTIFNECMEFMQTNFYGDGDGEAGKA